MESRMKLLALENGGVGAQAYFECKTLLAAAIQHANAWRHEDSVRAIVSASAKCIVTTSEDDDSLLLMASTAVRCRDSTYASRGHRRMGDSHPHERRV